jgi:cyclopropane-fatty-acyl-phospholipid synthase
VSESIIELESEARPEEQPGPFDGWARERVFALLETIEGGHLTIVEPGGTRRFGDPAHQPRAKVFVRNPRLYGALALRGAMGGAEAYMDGDWESDDLSAVIRIMARNRSALEAFGKCLSWLAKPSLALFHRFRRNTVAGSRRNIADHYDLGNEFFELFLDPTMMYSSGFFHDERTSMEEASAIKLERICQKLDLGPDDHVLEIGSGWGGFAIHAARHYGCRVTTTTISRAQHELASQRVREAGLSDRIEVLLQDYRALEGEYDKLVSIEMIEAVGHENLGEFMRVCGQRLRDDGCAVIQAITIADRDYEADRRSVDFIKRYIFPGGQLVSVAAVSEAAARESSLRMTHMEDFGPHYAETLRRWRETMYRNLEKIRALGLPERFLRMWEYYFCYCEAGFDERNIGVAQIVFEQPSTRRLSVLGSFSDRMADLQRAPRLVAGATTHH